MSRDRTPYMTMKFVRTNMDSRSYNVLLAVCIIFALINTTFAKISNCGGVEEYDDDHRICCGGKTSAKIENQKCCGRTIYSTKDNICCGDQVRNKYGDTWNKSDAEKVEHECCGGKLVPADDYICCFGNALRLSEKQKIDKDNLLCCSETVVVNIWEKICCGGVGFFISEGRSCCNGEPYLDSEKKCELIDDKETLILTSQGVCRSQIYSYREKSCCHGKLNNFPTVSSEPYDFACCDLKAYNRKEKYCCPANHTIPKNEELFCCGNGYYNTTSQFCIDGTAREKEENKAMCGRHLYDTKQRSCCANAIVYNNETEACCEGAYFSIINKNMSCCNGRPLIEGEELCCKNNTPCPKGKPDDDDCCISDGKMSTFCTSENEICTVRGVVKVEKGKLLCGDTVYDPNEEICCATRLAKRADGFNECCGFYTPYNSDKQICCFNYQVFDMSTDSGSCCEIDLKGYLNDDASNPCKCNGIRMNTTTEKCCRGKLYDTSDKTISWQCCGRKLINTTEKACCADRFPYKRNGNHNCCNHQQLYKSKNFVCEKNEESGRCIVEPKGTYKRKSDTQRLCSKTAFRGSDMLIQQACWRTHAMTAKVTRVSFKRGIKRVIVTLGLRRVRPIGRRDAVGVAKKDLSLSSEGDNELSVNVDKITLVIAIERKKNWCHKNKFLKLLGKKVIVLHDKKLARKVKIRRDDHIHIAPASKRNVNYVREADSEFCSNFTSSSVGKSKKCYIERGGGSNVKEEQETDLSTSSHVR